MVVEHLGLSKNCGLLLIISLLFQSEFSALSAQISHSDTCEIDNTEHADIQRISATNITTEKSQIQFTQKLSTHQLELKNMGNFTQMIQSLPMVYNLQSGNSLGKPMVQGFVGLRVPIFKNNLRLEGQSWGLDHAPELDVNSIQHIQLLSGVASMMLTSEGFGNPISISSIQNFNHPPHYWDGKFSLGYQTNGNGFNLAGQLQGHNTYISIRSRIAGNYKTPDYWVYNTGLQEYSFQIQHHFAVKNTKIQQIWGAESYYLKAGIMMESHIGSIADLQNAIQRNTPSYPSIFQYNINKPQQVSNQNHVYLMRSNQLNSKKFGYLYLNSQYSLQSNLRQEFDPHKNPNIHFPQLNLLQITAKSTQEIVNNLAFQANFINEIQWQDFGGYYYVPGYFQWHSGIATSKSIIKTKGILHYGIRGDAYYRNVNHIYGNSSNSEQQTYVAPSAAISWRSRKQSSMVGMGDIVYNPVEFEARNGHYEIHYNHLWRMPAVNELYARGVHHGTASYEEGNPNLKPEWAEKLEFQWFGKQKYLFPNFISQGPILQFSAIAFGLYSPNLIHLFPQAQPMLTVRGAFPYYRFAQLPTVYAGLQPNFTIKYKKWAWQHQFQFTYAQLLPANNTGLNNPKYPPFLPPINYAQSFQITLKNWFIQADAKWVTKQIWYNQNLDLAPPPNNYLLLNFLVNYKPNKTSDHSFTLFAQNATNQRYRDYLDRFRYFMDQPGINIGIKYNYHFHQHHPNH